MAALHDGRGRSEKDVRSELTKVIRSDPPTHSGSPRACGLAVGFAPGGRPPDTVQLSAAGWPPVSDWFTASASQEFSDFNQALLASVRTAINAGKASDQALADLKQPEKFSAYAMSGAKDNVPKIYAELAK